MEWTWRPHPANDGWPIRRRKRSVGAGAYIIPPKAPTARPHLSGQSSWSTVRPFSGSLGLPDLSVYILVHKLAPGYDKETEKQTLASPTEETERLEMADSERVLGLKTIID